MGLLDKVRNIPNNPLAMASLGLLSMPTQSHHPINPLQYAMQGMQMGVNNQKNQQALMAQQEAMQMRQAEYAMRVADYQRRMQAEMEAKAQKAAQKAALEEALKTLPPSEQAIARALGTEYLKMRVESQYDTPSLPAGYKLNEQGQRVLDPEYWQARKDVAANARSESPYFTQVTGGDGRVYAFNSRTGEIQLATNPDGTPITAAQYTPELRGDIKRSEAAGTVTGTQTTEANLDLPNTIAKAEQTIEQVERLKTHPGMPDVVGIPDPVTLGGRVFGSRGADFRARLEQIQGAQFLQAYETLKGGGQITEVEGQKAQNAIARMQSTQSEKAFVEAADEFIGVVKRGLERAKRKAAMSPNQTMTPGGMPVTPQFDAPRDSNVVDWNNL